MKWIKLFTIMAVTLAFWGCYGTWFHDWQSYNSSYKNLEHLSFSWFGYQAPTAEDRQDTKEDHWWGNAYK